MNATTRTTHPHAEDIDRYGDVLTAMRHAPAAEGRRRLNDLAVSYLATLADAAHLATATATAATAAADARLVLSPVSLREALAGAPVKGAHLTHPPSIVWAVINGVDNRRVAEGNHVAAYAAQWYAYVAGAALRAVVDGKPCDAADLERIGDAHNARRPEYDHHTPLWAAGNRPILPPLTRLATGHNSLDVPVGTAWARLTEIYAAAELLDRTGGALGELLDRVDTEGGADDEAAHEARMRREARRTVDGLVPALVAFGNAARIAARFGHADPTTPDADHLAAYLTHLATYGEHPGEQGAEADTVTPAPADGGE